VQNLASIFDSSRLDALWLQTGVTYRKYSCDNLFVPE